MRKLKLTVEDLAVVSFPTDAVEQERGTVDAHAISGNHLTCKSCLTNITCCTPLI